MWSMCPISRLKFETLSAGKRCWLEIGLLAGPACQVFNFFPGRDGKGHGRVSVSTSVITWVLVWFRLVLLLVFGVIKLVTFFDSFRFTLVFLLFYLFTPDRVSYVETDTRFQSSTSINHTSQHVLRHGVQSLFKTNNASSSLANPTLAVSRASGSVASTRACTRPLACFSRTSTTTPSWRCAWYTWGSSARRLRRQRRLTRSTPGSRFVSPPNTSVG